MEKEEKELQENKEQLSELDVTDAKNMELDELRDNVLDVINRKDAKALKEIFENVPNIDIAEAIYDVDDVKVLLYIFRVITSEYSADFFSELSSEQQELIISSFTDAEIVKLLENSFADDIVDTLEEMPANLVHRVLKVAPKELRKEINMLLNYEEDTAGSLMTTEYLEMKDTMTVEEVIEQIREKGRDAETIYTIFIKDKYRTMVGTVDLDDLVFAKKTETMGDIMNRDFVTCHVNDDQEQVANMFKRYDLNAMAVVNKENKIIGIITIDDVVDIIVEEANEDISHLSSVSNMEEPYLKTPVFKIVLKCLPWIIALMILQVGSAAITSNFDHLISSFAILAVFSPLILDAGGNAGGQTTTMIVRSLAMDEFQKGDFKRVLWKEFRVAFLLALCIGTFAFGWTLFEMAVLQIGDVSSFSNEYGTFGTQLFVSALVGSTLMVTMLISRMIGCMLPFFAKKIHIDPAVMCGPFTTTVVDIVSLLTYFLIWQNVFAPLLSL